MERKPDEPSGQSQISETLGDKRSEEHHQLKEISMSKVIAFAPVFVRRVLSHEATKKGAASAAAGLLVGIICELAWPSA